MIEFIVTAFYFLAAIFILYKWKWLHLEMPSLHIIPLIFISKFIIAIAYWQLHLYFYQGGDTFAFYQDSLLIYNSFFDNPLKYLFLTFGPNNFERSPDFIFQETDAMGFWWNTSNYTVVRFYALCNLISGGSVYVAFLVLSFCVSLSSILLFKTIYRLNPDVKWIIFISIMALPSVVFWNSGVHKEALIFCCFSAIVFLVYQITHFTRHLFLSISILLILFFFCWLLRSYVFYLLLTGVFAVFISKLIAQKTSLIFLSIYSLAFLAAVTFSFSQIYYSKEYKGNIFEFITIKQQQFKNMKGGNSEIETIELTPDFFTFFYQTPKSFFRAFYLPFFLKTKNIFSFYFITENILLLLFILMLMWHTRWKKLLQSSYSLLFLMTGFFLMTLIGFVVPNIGTGLRYRSFPLFLLILSMLPVLREIKFLTKKKANS